MNKVSERIKLFKSLHEGTHIKSEARLMYDVLNNISSIKESVDMTSTKKKAELKAEINNLWNKLYKNMNENNIIKWKHPYAPYFTDFEIEDFKGYYYKEHTDPTVQDDTDHHKSYGSKVVELQNKMKLTNNPDEINSIKQELISMGWNPEVEFSAVNNKYAVDRIASHETFIMNAKCNIYNVELEMNTFDSDNAVYDYKNPQRDILLCALMKDDSVLYGINSIPVIENGTICDIYGVYIPKDITEVIIKSEPYKHPKSFKESGFSVDNKYNAFRNFYNIIREAGIHSRFNIYILCNDYPYDSNKFEPYIEFMLRSDEYNPEESAFIGTYIYPTTIDY